MKKFCRMISVALLLSILASVCFGSMSVQAAVAKTDSGKVYIGTRLESDDGVYSFDLGDGFSWSYNTKTLTLEINGKGNFPVPIYNVFASAERQLFTRTRPWTEHYTTIHINDGITDVEFCDGLVEIDIDRLPDTLILGKDYKGTEQKVITELRFQEPNMEYRVSPDNPYYASYDGVLYTKGYKELIHCPRQKNSIKFHPNTQVIKEWAFDHTSIASPIVFPWGLQKIEAPVFNNRVDIVTVVMPDTLLPGQRTGALKTTLYCSTKKQADIVPFQSSSYDVCIVDDKKTYDYYGVKPNSLHTFENGKTYFFGPNYEYAKGWKQASGNWYYFNDYGAAVVKIWLKSGNKWYFMQADGTMATNKWIQWYNKWYYVGSDGAMYANRSEERR